MNERETTTLTIEGHDFLVKTYATAREVNAIQAAYFRGTKVELVGDQPKISDFNPSIQGEVHKEMISQMVLLIDGNAENIVDRCLDSFPADVYNQLVAQLDAIVTKKKS